MWLQNTKSDRDDGAAVCMRNSAGYHHVSSCSVKVHIVTTKINLILHENVS